MGKTEAQSCFGSEFDCKDVVFRSCEQESLEDLEIYGHRGDFGGSGRVGVFVGDFVNRFD